MTEQQRRAATGAVKSKTNWLGLSVIVLTYAQANLAQLEGMVSAGTLKTVGFALGIAIIVNRFFTTQPLSQK